MLKKLTLIYLGLLLSITSFAQTLTLSSSTICDPSITTLAIDATVHDFDEINGLSGTFCFDPTVLQFVNVTDIETTLNSPGGLSTANFNTNYLANGDLALTWSNFSVPVDYNNVSTTIFTLNFNIIGTGNTTVTLKDGTGDGTLDPTTGGAFTPYQILIPPLTDVPQADAVSTISVGNGDPLSISCPGNVTMQSSDGNPVSVPNIPATIAGGCGTMTTTYTSVATNGTDDASNDMFPVGTTTVTYTVTDGTDTETCSFDVIIEDTSTPSDPSLNVSAVTADCGATMFEVPITVQNYNDILGLQGTISFDPALLEYNSITFFNASATGFDVTDFNLTTFIANGGITFNWTAGGPITLSDDEILFTLKFNILASFTSTIVTIGSSDFAGNPATPYGFLPLGVPPSFDFYPDTQNTVTFAGGGTNPPTALCQDVTVQLDINGNASIATTDIDNGSTDDCGNVTLALDQTVFNCSNTGTNTVTLTVTDEDNMSSTCTATVTVEDNIAPSIICPTSLTDQSTDGNNVIVNGLSATVNDPCGIASVTYTTDNAAVPASALTGLNDISGEDFPVGTTTVTYTVTDNNGNPASCSFTVTIEPPVTNDPPTITINNTNVECDATMFEVDFTANDLINLIGIQGTVSWDPNLLQFNTITFIDPTAAADGFDDTDFNTVDHLPSSVTFNWVADSAPVNIPDENILFTLKFNIVGSFTSTDVLLDGSITPYFISQVGVPPILINPPTSLGTVSISGGGGAPPTALCQGATVQLDADGNASITTADIDNGSFDDCGDVTLSLNTDQFTCSNTGFNIVTLTVTDENNMSSSCIATVTVQDPISPVANCQGITVELDASGNASITAAQIDNGSSDNCSIVSMTVSPNTFDCSNIGANTVTLTVTDGSNNASTCTATVIVEDNSMTTVSCQNITLPLDASGNVTADPATIYTGSGSGCSGNAPTLSLDINQFDCSDVGDNAVVLTVDFGSGNVETCAATITVTEAAPTAICQDITIHLDPTGNVSISETDIDNGSFDDCGIASMLLDDNSFNCFDIGANTINLVLTDNDGNTSLCQATVTVLDTVPPVLTCPADVFITINNETPIAVNAIGPNSTDNCGAVAITYTTTEPSITPDNDGDASGNTFPPGETIVTYYGTDGGGNVDSCSFSVNIVSPSTTDVILVVENDTLDCNETTTSIDITAENFTNIIGLQSTIDWDEAVLDFTSVSNINPNLPGFLTGNFNYSFTANGQLTFNWTLNDVVGVNLSPTDVLFTLNFDLVGALGSSTNICFNSDITPFFVSFPNTEFPFNPQIATPSNIKGLVLVDDIEVPVVSNCPTDIIQDLDANCEANITWVAPTFTDNCDANLTIVNSHNSGDLFPIGTTTVSYTATDDLGNSTTCTFNVTISDTTVPNIVCPTSITLNTDEAECSAVHTWDEPIASDNCGIVSVTSNFQSGDAFPIGTTIVTYNVTDDNGLTTSCSFSITVNDNEGPTLTNCPIGPLAQGVDFDACGADVSWIPPTALDNCGAGNLTITSTHQPNDFFDLGTTTVTYYVEDEAGFIDSCSFDIVIDDNVPPYFENCPSNILVPADPTLCGANVTWFLPTAFDGCSEVTIDSTFIGNFFDIGSDTIVYYAFDEAGNSATCDFIVTVVDNTAPQLFCPEDIEMGIEQGSCGATVIWDVPTTSDDCSTPTLVSSHNPGDFFEPGVTTVTYTSTDGFGNITTCDFMITIIDDIPLEIINCPNNSFYVSDPDLCGANAFWASPSLQNGCLAATLDSTHTSGDLFPIGTTTIMYTAIDEAGNTDTCSFNIIVSGVTSISIANCPIDISQNSDPDTCGAFISWIEPTVEGACGMSSISGTHTPGDLFPIGTTTVTYTAMDDAGNMAECMFDVTVNGIGLSFVGCPTNITETAPLGMCELPVAWTIPTTEGGCGEMTITSTHEPNDTFMVGTTTVIYSATDAAGNTAECSFDVTVNGTDLALINCPTDINMTGGGAACTASVSWNAPIIQGGCMVTTTASHEPGQVFAQGTTEVIYTAFDELGNTDTCRFNVIVSCPVDMLEINCDASVTLDTDLDTCGTNHTILTPIVSGGTGATTITSDYTSDFFPVGTTTVTYTVTDELGATATCSVDVTVKTSSISITNAPIDQTLTCETIATWDEPTISGSCDLMITSTHNSGDSFPTGTTTVTYTVTDGLGTTETISFDITVEMPALLIDNCPVVDTIIPQPQNGCQAPAFWSTPTAQGGCGTISLVSNSHNSGDLFQEGTTTVTYTFADEAGNTVDCIFDIVIQVAPLVITNCPTDITVDATPGECGAEVFYSPPQISGGCGLSPYITQNLFPGSFFELGTTTLEIGTINMNNDTTIACTFNITVNPEPLTILNCPTDTTITADATSCGANVSWDEPSIAGNCFGGDITSSHNSGDFFGIGTTTVTYTVSDTLGNTDSCSFDITITGSSLAIDCPTDIVQQSDPNNCGAIVTLPNPSITGDCHGGIFTSSHSSDSFFDIGTTTVTYTVTDTLDNEVSCSFDITINGPTLAIDCPANVVQQNDPNSCGAIVTLPNPTITGDCHGGIFTSSHPSGSFFGSGTTSVTYTVTDTLDNEVSCSFDVIVDGMGGNNGMFSFANCPPDTINFVDSSPDFCGNLVAWDTTIVGCPVGNVSITFSHPPNSLFPLGQTPVTMSATDEAGNSTSCSFILDVYDTIDPQIACPANVIDTIPFGQTSTIITGIGPSPTDNCAVDQVTFELSGATVLPLGFTTANGASFNVGVTTVTYTVADEAGNTSACTFTVTIVNDEPECTTAIICPPAAQFNTDLDQCGAQVSGIDPGINSDCATTTTYTFDGATTGSGSGLFDENLNVGETTVNFTVTNDIGQVSTCSVTVTIVDNQLPVLTGCDDITVELAMGTCSVEVDWDIPVATDNCGIMNVASSGTPPQTFEVGVHTISYLARDLSGNISEPCEVTITVIDTQIPFIECPTDITVDADGSCQGVATWTMSQTLDNCMIDTVICTHNSGDLFPLGVTQVVCTAFDLAGNEATCSFLVTVEDNTAPEFLTCDNYTQEAEADVCGANAFWTPPTATDNCGNITNIESSHPLGSFFGVGTTTVTYTMTDDAGNQNTCSFEVTITDNQAPVLISCPSDITLVPDVLDCSVLGNWNAPIFQDNCTSGVNLTVVSNVALGDTLAVGTTTVTYTATDSNGNSSECTFDVTVEDNSAPTFENCPDDITLSANPGTCEANLPEWIDPNLVDNCGTFGNFTIINSHDPGDLIDVGIDTVFITALNDAGDFIQCFFVVTVLDEELPVVTCPADVIVNAAGSVVSDPDGIIDSIVNVSCNEALIFYGAPLSASDNCPNATIAQTLGQGNGEIFMTGNNVIEYTMTDASGNVSSCDFTIQVLGLSELDVMVMPSDTVCEGDNVSFTWENIANTTYTWQTPNPDCFIDVVPTPNIENISVDCAGTYYVTVTDQTNGCVFTDSIVIEVNSLPEVSVNLDPTITLDCTDGNQDLIIQTGLITVTPDTYEWTGPGAFTSNASTIVIPNATSANAGTYTLITSANGCTATQTIDVDITDDLSGTTPELAIDCDFICLGETCQITGETFGNNVIYDWFAMPDATAGIPVNSNNNVITVQPTEAGSFTYFYSVIGADGCATDTANISIMVIDADVPPELTEDIAETCLDEEITINSIVNDILPTDNYTISIMADVSNGTLVNNFDGTFTYVPESGYVGADQYIYEICYESCAGDQLCDFAVVTIDVSVSLAQCVTECEVPNIITPNNDGINDELSILCLESGNYPENSIIIYNQWGDEVFWAEPYNNDWKGTYNQEDLPDGTYYYIFKLNQNSEGEKGFITIFR